MIFKDLSGSELYQNEPMAGHTTFRVGGPADWLLLPRSEEEILRALALAGDAGIPVTVMGNGSNLIVRDGGIRGLVIKIHKGMSDISVHGDRLCAQAGATLRQVANAACDACLTGLEFAAGIPGDVGGAACMNAGAYGGEMAQAVESVRALTRQGEIVTCAREDLCFGHRQSRIMQEHWIVTQVTFALKAGDCQSIRSLMEDYDARRTASQPLEMPSAGSVFKRPQGHYAGRLIEAAGLKGRKIGGAQVSPKHAGFIVNTGDASARDIADLIACIQKEVYEKFAVRLETEVRLIGEDA